MNDKDYYKILGLAESATEKEIKEAYRKLAKKYHPDTRHNNHAAEEKFKEISEAYAVLGNKERRAKYDQARKFGAFTGGYGSQQGFDFSSMFRGKGRRAQGFGGSVDFEEMFGNIFSGAGGSPFRRGPQRGQDVAAELTVPFTIAAKGGKQTIAVAMNEPCSQCHGQGSLGYGRSVCVACGGKGVVEKQKRIAVTIPPGTQHGKKMRLKGLGSPAPAGGTPGDLLITVHVGSHPEYNAKGLDLHKTVDISFLQAILGDKIRVDTFDRGSIALKIPAGTQSGKVFKLKGLGLVSGKKRGDFYVMLRVTVPTRINDAQKDALKKFAKEGGLPIPDGSK